MKTILMSLLLIGSMAGFVSCEGGPESASEKIEKLEEKAEVGQSLLLEINEYEAKMEDDGEIKFGTNFNRSNNGVSGREITIKFTGETLEEAYEAREYLRSYVDMVQDLLSDYPSDQFYMSGRAELKTKVQLAKQMISKINKL